MRAFSANDILMLFDHGAGLHAVDRALLVLRCALPEADYEELVRLPLGQRDRLLLEVRQRTFGDVLEAHTECPACKERLEFSLSCAEMLANTPIEAVKAQPVTIEGTQFELRCPDSRDAAEAAACVDVETASARLLERCVKPNGETVFLGDKISGSQRAVIAAALAALDPAAEILLDLSCPVCSYGCQPLFDINQVLWTEIRGRARRLLQEVDALARVYHWRETEILGMSEARRAWYLEMALS